MTRKQATKTPNGSAHSKKVPGNKAGAPAMEPAKPASIPAKPNVASKPTAPKAAEAPAKAPAVKAPANNKASPVPPPPPALDVEAISAATGASEPPAVDNKKLAGAAAHAVELIEAGDGQAVVRQAAAMEDASVNQSSQAARVVQEVAERKPELCVGAIDRFARLLASDNPRVVQTCSVALPALARIAPAKVAKQLNTLTASWDRTGEVGQDGLVRTFAALCTASVAYQKRLEPALAKALRDADPKHLPRWTEVVLPALKGEPHARARIVVEDRIPELPRPIAQKIADFLGIKLRPVQR